MERVTLEILEGPDYTTDDDGWEHHAYTVRLSYDGRSMDTPWRQGLGITDDPNARDVLESMLSTTSGADFDEYTFEEWASDYGYDPDSRRAEKVWHAVRAEAAQLRILLGDAYDTYDRIGDPELAARELTL